MDEAKLLTMKHYNQVGNIYASNSPSLSRYFMFKLNDTLLHLGQGEINNKTREAFENKMVGHQCPRCGSLLSDDGTGNSSVKIKPRKGPSKKTLKLIKRCNMFSNWNKLNSKARKDILRYKRQTNKLVINCVICGQSSTDCVKRKQKPSNTSLPSTPVPSVRTLLRTPVSSGSKTRTPNSHTIPTPSSSAKKRSAKLQKHAQLQMMLDQNKQEKQRAQHSPLHGFLKSL